MPAKKKSTKSSSHSPLALARYERLLVDWKKRPFELRVKYPKVYQLGYGSLVRREIGKQSVHDGNAKEGRAEVRLSVWLFETKRDAASALSRLKKLGLRGVAAKIKRRAKPNKRAILGVATKRRKTSAAKKVRKAGGKKRKTGAKKKGGAKRKRSRSTAMARYSY